MWLLISVLWGLLIGTSGFAASDWVPHPCPQGIDFSRCLEILYHPRFAKVVHTVREGDRSREILEFQLDRKTRPLMIRDCDRTRCEVKALSSTDYLWIENNELRRIDGSTGKESSAPVRNRLDWPEKAEWKALENPDRERRTLSLRTFEGIPFFSFYYLPNAYDPARAYPVVFVIGGGSGPFYSRPDSAGFLESPATIERFRQRGYIVVYANVRGKAWVNHPFWLSGPGNLHQTIVSDFVTILDGLSSLHRIDKNVRLIGISQGGHFAGLIATHLSRVLAPYRIKKTLLSSGVVDLVGAYFEFFKNSPPTLDYTDTLFAKGALCYRPPEITSDAIWSLTHRRELEWYALEKAKYFLLKDTPPCNTEAFLKMSPLESAENWQGSLHFLLGKQEIPACGLEGIERLSKRLPPGRIERIVEHDFGHTNFSSPGGTKLWLKELDLFLR